ncbi:MAG: O-antigen ligase family protein [Candidatus Riflebacteria bacterium]|nr:O-antigen ligase family protein [Candidatus Riflebacteria bacterium]
MTGAIIFCSLMQTAGVRQGSASTQPATSPGSVRALDVGARFESPVAWLLTIYATSTLFSTAALSISLWSLVLIYIWLRLSRKCGVLDWNVLRSGPPLALYVIWCLQGVFFGTSPGTTFRNLGEVQRFFVPMLMRPLGAGRSVMTKVVPALFCTSALAAAYAIGQAMAFGVDRPRGLSSGPTFLAALLVTTASMFVAHVLFDRNGWRYSLCLWSGLAITVAGVIVTQTRSALLGIAAGAVVGLCLPERGRVRFVWPTALRVAVLLVAVAVVAIAARNGIVARLRAGANLNEPGTQYRLLAWKASLLMMRDHPLAGVGRFCFTPAHERYSRPEEGRKPDAECNVVTLGAELGIPGIVAYVWLMVRLLVTLHGRTSLFPEPGPERAFLMGTGLATVAFIVTGMTINNWSYLMASSLWWFLLGLASRIGEEGDCDTPPSATDLEVRRP